jgi:hypothetical protein
VPVQVEPGATLVSGGAVGRAATERRPSERGATIQPPRGPSVVSKLANMRPAYLAIGAGAFFFVLMALVILLVLLLRGR